MQYLIYIPYSHCHISYIHNIDACTLLCIMHPLKIRGQLGVVHSVLDNGDLSVLYGSKRWTLNPVSVVKVGGG